MLLQSRLFDGIVHHRVGWGDTATLLVLAEALDTDILLFTTPDARVSGKNLVNRPRPLRFRKAGRAGNAAPRRLYCRFHDSHYIFLEKFRKDGKKVGVYASHDHYLQGTHDVATGTCVSSHPTRL